jgi:hypothetical protein
VAKCKGITVYNYNHYGKVHLESQAQVMLRFFDLLNLTDENTACCICDLAHEDSLTQLNPCSVTEVYGNCV